MWCDCFSVVLFLSSKNIRVGEPVQMWKFPNNEEKKHQTNLQIPKHGQIYHTHNARKINSQFDLFYYLISWQTYFFL